MEAVRQSVQNQSYKAAHAIRNKLHAVNDRIEFAAWTVTDYYDYIAPVAVVRLREILIRIRSKIAFYNSMPRKQLMRSAGTYFAGVIAVLILVGAPAGAVFQQVKFSGNGSVEDAAATDDALLVIAAEPPAKADFYDSAPVYAEPEQKQPQTVPAFIGEQAISVSSIEGFSFVSHIDDYNGGMFMADDFILETDISDFYYLGELPEATAELSMLSQDVFLSLQETQNAAFDRTQELVQQLSPELYEPQPDVADESDMSGSVSDSDSYSDSDSVYTGDYIWPAAGKISSAYGPRKTSVGSANHLGIDISGASGSPILAAAGGEVILSERSQTFGNYIQILHENGQITLYAHCSALLVSVGEIVQQGQEIGKMGRTGIADGVHLHFELIIDSSNVDPMFYLPDSD